jgi:hypothetical protein
MAEALAARLRAEKKVRLSQPSCQSSVNPSMLTVVRWLGRKTT